MDKKESIGRVEYLLRTRKYTEQERNQIIDITNAQWDTIYDKTRKKFQKGCTYGQYGLILRRWFEDVIKDEEWKNYVV